MSKRVRKEWPSEDNRVEAQIKQAFRLTTTNAAVEIHVVRDGRSLGTLNIGEGGVIWHPVYAKKKVKLCWYQFAARLENRRSRSMIEVPPTI